ncbi:MAG: Asp23/Gls24 family envelope stress response protein [Lentisphaeria bacterium]|nr:Asp23/Gls24 family envelope stress response protein [Lentisphaeria bacterium]
MNEDNIKTNRSILPVQLREENSKFSVPSGTVRVHESVVASIVRKASCAVPAVAHLAGSSLVNNLADIVGSRKIFDRAISIEMGENAVKVEVRLVLKYGCNIPETASTVQQMIAEEITKITGMTVGSVNVIVADLETEEPQELPDEEEEPEDGLDEEEEKTAIPAVKK